MTVLIWNSHIPIEDSLLEVRALSKSLNSDVIENKGLSESINNEVGRLNKLNLINAEFLEEGDASLFSNSKDGVILFFVRRDLNRLKDSIAENSEPEN